MTLKLAAEVYSQTRISIIVHSKCSTPCKLGHCSLDYFLLLSFMPLLKLLRFTCWSKHCV